MGRCRRRKRRRAAFRTPVGTWSSRVKRIHDDVQGSAKPPAPRSRTRSRPTCSSPTSLTCPRSSDRGRSRSRPACPRRESSRCPPVRNTSRPAICRSISSSMFPATDVSGEPVPALLVADRARCDADLLGRRDRDGRWPGPAGRRVPAAGAGPVSRPHQLRTVREGPALSGRLPDRMGHADLASTPTLLPARRTPTRTGRSSIRRSGYRTATRSSASTRAAAGDRPAESTTSRSVRPMTSRRASPGPPIRNGRPAKSVRPVSHTSE